MKTTISPIRHEQTAANDRDKLFSYTISMDPCDLFAVYQSHHPSAKGERFYWKNADGNLKIVGIGIAKSLTSNSSETRFTDIQKQWDKLIQDAHIENNYDVAGTGPLLFGGFSFDIEQIQMDEWENFNDSLFYLPKIMITCFGKQYFLTVNQFGTLNQEEVEKIQDHLLYMKEQLTPLPKLLFEKEYDVEGWLQSVDKVVEVLKNTNMQKVVLARKLQLGFTDSLRSEPIIAQLLSQQSSSYIFSMEAGDSCFLGASPERLVEKNNNKVLSTCLAGSIGRGQDKQEDEQLGKSLLDDAKNRYEHELVVSMIKDALSPFCEEMDIPMEPLLLKKPYIQHLYTPVEGKAKPESSIFDMVQTLHPTPALGGVPTRSAMEIIREKENMDRGFYGSPVGWTDYRGNGEFIVGIRSGLINGSSVFLYAGCGLVADSVAEKELIETRIKFQPMLRAFGKENL